MALQADGYMDRPIKIAIPNAATLAIVNIIEVRVDGEAFPRAVVKADGNILKGNGTVAPT